MDDDLRRALLTKTPYQVTFQGDLVGRCYNVTPLRALSDGADELAGCIWRYISQCVRSGACDIQVDLKHHRGYVFEGLLPIAKFTITEGRRHAEGVYF